jgi:3-phenylpropionate/cinnamic acid dioxygenase small subunit
MMMTLDMRLAALERQQARLQAQHDIWHTITRYARGIDEQRHDDLEEVFTDDVVYQNYPWANQRPLVGKPLVLKAFRNYQHTFEHPRRFITNEQIHVHDDGTATVYANWFVVQSREGQSYCGWGYYDWEFRHEDGIWKISKMLIALDCMTTLERGWGMIEDRVMPLPRPSRS